MTAAPEMRRHLFTMIAMVLLVDALALGAYAVFVLKSAAPATRYVFTGVWTVVTLVIVLRGIDRVRAARRRGRAAAESESA
jgi:hypothetical protein